MFKKIFASLIIGSLLIITSGCGSNANTVSDSIPTDSDAMSSTTTDSTGISETEAIKTSVEGVVSINQYTYIDEDVKSTYNESEITGTINLSDSNITFDGEGVTVNGSTVNIIGGGTYLVKGTLKDGQIVVNAPKTATVRLILDGVSIKSSISSPLYALKGKKLIVTLKEGTKNYLEDATNYTFANTVDEEPDATLFSKIDLALNGEGTLTIKSNFKNGILSKDGLVIGSGTYNINSVNHGIRGKDYLYIVNGNFNIVALNDGLQSSNATDVSKGGIVIENGNFNITSRHDGIQAETTLHILNGSFKIVAGGGNDAVYEVTDDVEESTSFKGLKASGNILIEKGNINIDSYDDSIHSNANIEIYDGNFTLSTGDDAVHSDKNLYIRNGAINILKSYEGLEGEVITIDNGTINIVATDDGINASSGSNLTSDADLNVARVNPEDITPPVMTKDASGDRVRQAPTDADGNVIQRPAGNREERPVGGGGGGDRGGGFKADDSLWLYVNGGIITINAEADGIDSNGHILISGGEVYINGPSTTNGGNTALDSDGNINITGGTVVGVDNSNGQGFSTTSTQYSFNVMLTNIQKANSNIKVIDKNGLEILSFTPEKAYKGLVVSSPLLVKGETYSLLIDDINVATVTLDTIVTQVREDGGTYQGGGM